MIVLWMVILLTILAAGYSNTMRTETRITANLLHAAQAKSIAEAGIWRGVMSLLEKPSRRYWSTDGTKNIFPYHNGVVNIWIQDEAGKININASPSPHRLLYKLISTVQLNGTDERLMFEPSAVTQSILDWLDKDKNPRDHGAEDEDYRRQGYTYGAKDNLLNTLDELQLVMHMTADLFKKIKPAITIYSNHKGIDPSIAPRIALLALPGMTEAYADQYIATRSLKKGTRRLSGISSQYLSRTKNVVFTITSEGIIGQIHAFIEAVILIERGSKKNFLVLSWKEDSSSKPDRFSQEGQEEASRLEFDDT